MTSNVDLALAVYDVIRDIKDPEKAENLAQLGVVQKKDITVLQKGSFVYIRIEFTPTVPHCHLATLIGLCIRVKVSRDFPGRHKVCCTMLMSCRKLKKLCLFVYPDGHLSEGRKSLHGRRHQQTNKRQGESCGCSRKWVLEGHCLRLHWILSTMTQYYSGVKKYDFMLTKKMNCYTPTQRHLLSLFTLLHKTLEMKKRRNISRKKEDIRVPFPVIMQSGIIITTTNIHSSNIW